MMESNKCSIVVFIPSFSLPRREIGLMAVRQIFTKGREVMPSNVKKTTKKAVAGHDSRGKFAPGNKCGGRKAKPEWLNGKGIEALQYAYSVLKNDGERTDIRLQAAKMLAEYDLGKPKQQLDLDTNAVPQVVIIGDVLD